MIDNSNSVSEVQEQHRNMFLTIEERQIWNNKLKPGVYSKLKHQVESQTDFFWNIGYCWKMKRILSIEE